jgi:hypothetical protein
MRSSYTSTALLISTLCILGGTAIAGAATGLSRELRDQSAREHAARLPLYSTQLAGTVPAGSRSRMWALTEPSKESVFLTTDPFFPEMTYYAGNDGSITIASVGGEQRQIPGPSRDSRVVSLFVDINHRGTFFAVAGMQVYRTTNYGEAWTSMLVLAAPVPEGVRIPMLMDPRDPETLWVGDTMVMVTHDGGNTWTAVSGASGSGYFTAIAISFGYPQTVSVGLSDGRIWTARVGESESEPMSWTVARPRAGEVGSLAFDTDDEGPLFAAYREFAGPEGSNLYRSSDAGMTWSTAESLGIDFPEAPVNSIRTDAEGVYAAPEIGVLVSVDRGATWMTEAALPAGNYRDVEWRADASGQRYYAQGASGAVSTAANTAGCVWWQQDTGSGKEDNYLDTNYESGVWSKMIRLRSGSSTTCRFMPFGQKRTILTLWFNTDPAANNKVRAIALNHRNNSDISTSDAQYRVWYDKVSFLTDKTRIHFAMGTNSDRDQSGKYIVRARFLLMNLVASPSQPVRFLRQTGAVDTFPPTPLPGYAPAFPAALQGTCADFKSRTTNPDCLKHQLPVAVVQGPHSQSDNDECRWEPKTTAVPCTAGLQGMLTFNPSGSCSHRDMTLIVCWGSIISTSVNACSVRSAQTPSPLDLFHPASNSGPKTTCASAPPVSDTQDW